MCAKFRCASPHIKKALGILYPGELIPTTRTRTTRVAFWTRLPCLKIQTLECVVVKGQRSIFNIASILFLRAFYVSQICCCLYAGNNVSIWITLSIQQAVFVHRRTTKGIQLLQCFTALCPGMLMRPECSENENENEARGVRTRTRTRPK